MKKAFLQLAHRWDRFWFGPQDLLGLATMRIILCGTMTLMYFFRSFYMNYYDETGWIPRSKALFAFPELIRPAFAWFFWPDSWNLPVHSVLVLSLALLTLGIGGRALMALAWILDMGFIQRNYAVNFGADLICGIFLFYMLFTQSCERLSLVNYFRKKKVFRQSDPLSSIMIRMMQFQIFVIYTYTGLEKLKGATWWDGTALWSVFANPQMVAFDMTFMRYFPTLIAMLSLLTLCFEIYFVPAVLNRRTRLLWFVIGWGFHAGIAFSMGLLPFSAVMVSTYFLFLNPLEMRREFVSFWESLKKTFSSRGVPS